MGGGMMKEIRKSRERKRRGEGAKEILRKTHLNSSTKSPLKSSGIFNLSRTDCSYISILLFSSRNSIFSTDPLMHPMDIKNTRV
jgi:hypothetical protein